MKRKAQPLQQIKVTQYPRDRKGEPLPNMHPIVFTTTEDNIKALNIDILNRPYKVFDGSVWYPCFKEEIEWL